MTDWSRILLSALRYSHQAGLAYRSCETRVMSHHGAFPLSPWVNNDTYNVTAATVIRPTTQDRRTFVRNYESHSPIFITSARIFEYFQTKASADQLIIFDFCGAVRPITVRIVMLQTTSYIRRTGKYQSQKAKCSGTSKRTSASPTFHDIRAATPRQRTVYIHVVIHAWCAPCRVWTASDLEVIDYDAADEKRYRLFKSHRDERLVVHIGVVTIWHIFESDSGRRRGAHDRAS